MAVLKDLIVHGNSRFINGASFNKLKADDLAAEQGYFNKLVAVNGDISNLNVDDLTAQNATVIGLLDVKGELHTNSWTNANIATIDGSFYITPTVSCASGTFAYDGTNITVTAASGSSFGVDSLYTYTTSGTVTTYSSWAQYSRVLLTGEVQLNGSNEWQPLGTIRGQIVSSSTSVIKINNLSDSQGTTPIATLTDLGSTNISGASFRKVKVSLYERASNSTSFYPIGIYMTALGAKGKTFIDIYGGGDAKGSVITNNIDSGAMAKPVLRIGNLGGLPKVANQTPSGWGIYTSNGFFEGAIVAKEGYIGNTGSYWTIGGGTSAGATYMYSGPSTVSATSTAGTYLGTNGFLNVSAAGVTNRPYAQITNGVLTAQGAVIQGALTASSLSTGGRTSSSSAAGTYIDNNGAIYGGNNKFTVTSAGVLTATGAVIEGTIDATSFKARDSNLKTRAEVNLNGLLIYDDTGTSTTYGNLIAQFGTTARIGKINNVRVEIDEDSFIMLDGSGTEFAHIGSPIGTKITDSFVYSSSADFTLSSLPSGTVVVKINDTATTDFTLSGTTLTITRTLTAGDQVTATYTTTSEIKYYSMGLRIGNVGQYSMAEGFNTTASGMYSHAEGNNTEATGAYSHAEGWGTLARGAYSHAEGYGYKQHLPSTTRAMGNYSHAEGYASGAYGSASHAEGSSTYAGGIASHAEGIFNYAYADYSHAQGYRTYASAKAQTVIGTYNITDTATTTTHPNRDAGYRKYALIIGNGTAENKKNNALAVTWDGNIECGDYSGNYKSIFDIFYPVGSYYETSLTDAIPSGSATPTATDMATLGSSWFDPNYAWGGTWSLENEGLVHIGAGSTYAVGATGGAKTSATGSHKLTTDEIPAHTHGKETLTGYFSIRPYSSSGGNIVGTNGIVSADTLSSTSYNGVSGASSGTKYQKITIDASHTHNSVGGSGTHSHGSVSTMQPYIVVNRWHRTAQEGYSK